MTDGVSFFRPVQDAGSVWAEESWTFHGGQAAPNSELGQLGDELPYIVSTCTYVDGVHIQPGMDCPHSYNGIDNDEFEPGWTVLNN